jgi:ribonuclease III
MDFTKFEERIGVSLKDKALLRQAFTHRSYINENKGAGLAHNERLEFLGDAVLQLVTTNFLYKKFPEMQEGEMTSVRAALVNADACAAVASDLGANDFLLLSKGEARDSGRARQYILANTLEALIGAIYLDQGFDEAEKFILTHITSHADEIVAKGTWIDAKSLFQAEAQERASVTPTYRVISESGPDHDKHFNVGVYLGNELIGEGEGKSKQDAEQEAAREALKNKGWNK